jgi:SAM-dependent methyltransferase
MSGHDPVDQPSSWVARFAPLIPRGEVLDLACGSGRHTRLLAGIGQRVLAVDRDAEALSKIAGANISTMEYDLERGADHRVSWPFESNRFAGIIVTNYLHRPLLTSILASLAPNGVLLYETFAHGNGRFGKPSNPAFLLESGELLRTVSANSAGFMRVIAFEDGYVGQPRPAMVQRICAIRAGLDAAPESLRLQ